MPTPDSAAVAACRAMPRSVSSATMWVSVPLIAMTSRKKAIASAQNRPERNAAPASMPGSDTAVHAVARARAACGGSRRNNATGTKAIDQHRDAQPEIGGAPAERGDQRRRELWHDCDAEPDPGDADAEGKAPLRSTIASAPPHTGSACRCRRPRRRAANSR